MAKKNDVNKKTKKPKDKAKGWRITGIVFICIIALILICSLVGCIGNSANVRHIKSLQAVAADDKVEPLSAPVIDKETGYWTFTCDREFKILQLTDVHIGGGFLSLGKDNKAIDAVYDMISYTKPDLVIITGDMAYPVPFSSGSFNNLTPTKIFAQLMEQMGIYWAFGYGNHDTEVYSYYDREEISEYYLNSGLKRCLFQRGPKDVDGEGNYVINVKNSSGIITQSLFILDSHAYSKGFFRDYDNLHQNQVDWYESEVKRLTEINKSHGATDVIKSLMFFHIPLVEYKTAFDEYKNNGYKDTDNVKYYYGIVGEPNDLISCGVNQDNMFEKMIELKSTQGVFAGHDHLNNFSLDYNGGSGDYYVRLTYGLSIDYLAYFGIAKKTAQRGGTVITLKPDTTFDCYGVRMLDKHEIRKVGDFEK